MKLVIILAMLLSSFLAAAKGSEKDKQNFETRKQRLLKRIEQKIERLGNRLTKAKEAKSCVESASEKGALKECRDKMKKERIKHKGRKKNS